MDILSEPESMTAVIGWSQAPEATVSEPESMTAVIGWSQRIWCQSHSLQQQLYGGASGYSVIARFYDRSYGVEPVDMVSEPVDMVLEPVDMVVL